MGCGQECEQRGVVIALFALAFIAASVLAAVACVYTTWKFRHRDSGVWKRPLFTVIGALGALTGGTLFALVVAAAA
jgi:heme/copper-type cytochrome/quinol oxidase subunit 1